MKFGRVYSYDNAEEAKEYLGKRGVFSVSLCEIIEIPEFQYSGRLARVDSTLTYPFERQAGQEEVTRKGILFLYFRPILEEEELMTHEELAEWEARGFGLHSYGKGSFWSTSNSYTEEERKKKVRETLVIRYFGSDEILKPTRAIFLKDCRKDN